MSTDKRPGVSHKKQGDSTFFPQQHPLTVKRKPSDKRGRGK